MSDRLYRLMTTGGIPPLSYYFARFIARGCGLAPDSMLGCSAALVSLRNLQGDVCVDLAAHAGRPLFDGGADAGAAPRAPDLDQWLEILSGAAWVGAPGSEAPLILDRRHLYLAKYWRYEQRVATDLGARLARCEGLDVPRLAAGLARLFPVAGDAGPDWQRIAAVIAVSRRFAVVSGGPGTGKTTTVVKVLALLLEQDPQLRIALAAPTGKAAARLSDAVRTGKGRVDSDRSVLARIPEDAGTIHRLLGAGFGGVLRHDGDNPLLVDCLVVDEASMIDLPMMARLLEALPERSRLILLGDRDQLASVEAGNVLGDITGHGREIRYSDEQMDFLGQVGALPIGADTVAGEPTPPSDAVGLLRVSYRFSGESGIGALARAVNAGRGEEALDLLEREDLRDISWVDTHRDRPEPTALDWAVERYARYLHAEGVGAALRALEQSRVLAALHRGPFGVDALNTAIASRLQSLGLIEGGDEYHG
ncbi:MAG: exodeoxyribonuclease V subunit alpha, partial [Thiohalocapsa sp.]